MNLNQNVIFIYFNKSFIYNYDVSINKIFWVVYCFFVFNLKSLI